MPSDIEIAQAATMKPIGDVASALGIPLENIEPYGHYKAKIGFDYLDSLKNETDGKLILVTAITPTPAGEGKTTTTVGLGDGLPDIAVPADMARRIGVFAGDVFGEEEDDVAGRAATDR